MQKTKFLIIFFMSVYRDINDVKQNLAFSGGDNILGNLLCRWQNKALIDIATWDGGEYFLKNTFNINQVKYHIVVQLKHRWRYPFVVFIRGLRAAWWALKTKKVVSEYIYSPSDFLPDSLPAFILKLKNPNCKWIASFYLFFPQPFSKNNPYKCARRIIGLFQYLAQLSIRYIIKYFADIVFVTSQPDVDFFITKKRGIDKIIVVRGGVNLDEYESVFDQPKRFSAVYMGRIHPQKGVLELIKIWKLVTKQIPGARLALIGQAQTTQEEKKLNCEVENLIKEYALNDLVERFGFLTGQEKIKIFKASKVVIHPAIYDSGGMSACEAMACGLPAVGFDLKALKTYYPKGMLKTKCFDLDEFAGNIVKLLSNQESYQKLSKEAIELVKERWDWNERSNEIYGSIFTREKQ